MVLDCIDSWSLHPYLLWIQWVFGLKETANEIILLLQNIFQKPLYSGEVSVNWKNTSSICVSLAPMTSRNPNSNKGIESRTAALDVGHGPCDILTLDELWHIRLYLGGWVDAIDHGKVASQPRLDPPPSSSHLLLFSSPPSPPPFLVCHFILDTINYL